jgi:CelD/BcsL family acetyltransferase involved in cellulose biosynthesis
MKNVQRGSATAVRAAKVLGALLRRRLPPRGGSPCGGRRVVTSAGMRCEQAPGLHVELVDDLELLREDWSALGERTGNLFATWEWNSLWWRQMGRGRRLTAAAVRDHSGALVGLLPAYLAIAAGPARVIRLLGHGQGDRLGPICMPADRARVSDALRAALRSEPWANALLLAEHLPVEDGWRTLLGARPMAHEGSPVLEIATRDWDEFLAGRSAGLRKQVRYQERRLAREHVMRYRLIEHDEELPAAMDTLFRLHGVRWGQAGVPEFADSQAFHRAFAASALARGWLRLWLLELDGCAVAAWHGFRFRGADWHYQSGRDPAWDRYSVGAVLLAHTIRDCVEAGIPRYLFLRGDEAYKLRFATSDPGLETVVVGTGVAARAAVAALDGLLRLPPAGRRRITRLIGA